MDQSTTPTSSSNIPAPPAGWLFTITHALIAIACFHLAFVFPSLGTLVLITLYCLCQLGRAAAGGTGRKAFYGGLILGVAMYGPQLAFFYSIFGPKAGLLWMIVGFWTGIFLLTLRHCHLRLGPTWTMLLTPLLWAGIEYFRSEVYYLKFTWLTPGLALAGLPGLSRVGFIGVYGLGIVSIATAALAIRHRLVGLVPMLLWACLLYLPDARRSPSIVTNSGTLLHVAGVQLEFPSELQAAQALEKLAIEHPEAQILVTSEHTFEAGVPASVRAVLRRHRRYLISGGTQLLPDGQFYNMAFVVGPDGEDVFSQAKCVPVQFVETNLAAAEQHVWDSPWGKIGIGVCYDLGYRRVTDELVRQGAQAIITPTMDPEDWGDYERRHLHGPLHVMRSAEYGIPTFGVWSSGVSTLTDATGRILATAPYPGQGATLSGPMILGHPGRIPLDRYVAPGCTALSGGIMAMLLITSFTNWLRLRRDRKQTIIA